MKQLSQIIALNLLGFNGLQIILALGTAILLLQVLVKSFLDGSRWKARKENREIESL
ncbi:hypothetical protein [Segetibacter koreensis]|uniref:hypothetical protein n=1 Tax=Segetibacter koreensis TaxID=398037 RepID=UPI00037A0921|nr:hypothetical protein [Segetibacter koreensis]